MGTVDVFVGNNLIIDFDIYSLWVDGYSVDECKRQIMRRMNNTTTSSPTSLGGSEHAGFSTSLSSSSSSPPMIRETFKESIVLKDITDHYFIFNKLEQYLYSPPRLKEQLLFQMSEEIVNKLIEKYYAYDSAVIRELLGHKLTQRQRKDLDDVCEKSDVRVRSCRRQFDNLKRIIRTVEDMRGSISKNINENFCLPSRLTENYAAMVFLARNQFELSKRKLNHLTLEDFVYCANQVIKNWSNESSDNDFSRDFLMNLKDLKILIERDFIEDHRKLVFNGLVRSYNSKDNRSVQTLDHLFKDLSKALVDIAYALNHSKEMKDIFLDLVERFIEPCQDERLNKTDIKCFLDEYKKRAHQLPDVCRENPRLLSFFDRYITTITNCIIQMYHS